MPKLKKGSTALAYEYIRERILNSEYPQGYALLPEQLAEAIGISRTPVREALLNLTNDGLVVTKARQGSYVKTMDGEEFREICELRLALESHAASLAAVNHTENQLRDIQQALEAMRALTERINRSPDEKPLLFGLISEDVRFHLAIITAANNQLIKKEILRLYLINRVMVGEPLSGTTKAPPISKAEIESKRNRTLAEHEEIVEAIVHRDAAGAKTAMERHVQLVITSYLETLQHSDRQQKPRVLTEDELNYRA